MKMARSWARAIVVLPLGISASIGCAWAQEVPPTQQGRQQPGEQGLELALTAGASWSDNILRVPVDEENGTLGQAGLTLGYAQRTSRLEADIDADVVYEHYFDDEFDDDVVGGIDGTLIADLVRERLSWFVQNNFGQITTDPFSADTPDNRENINYFTTGPDLSLRLGGSMSLQASARYSNTRYEESALDGERYSGALGLVRNISSASAVSLNAVSERIEFDAPGAVDYDRNQAFARYDARGSRTTLAVDVGYTWIDREPDTSDGMLARVSLTRRISESSTVTFGAGTQFSDAGDQFRAMQDQQGVSLGGESVIAVSDPFETRYGWAGWDFERNRTSFGLSARYSKDEYESVAAADRTVTAFDAYFGRQLSRALEAQLYARLEQEDFQTLDFEDEELQLGAALAWNIGRTLQVRVQYDHFDRDSSSPQSEYSENRSSVYVTWSPTGIR